MNTEFAVAWVGAGASILAAVFSWLSQRSAASRSAEATRVAADISAKAETKTNDKTVFVGSVTAERATWRSEMRASTSFLVGQLRSSASGVEVEWSPIFETISEISLRLNPSGRSTIDDERNKHPLDRDIHVVLEEILGSTHKTAVEHSEFAARLENNVALLLKREWEVSKREAEEGVVSRSSELVVNPNSRPRQS